MKVVYRKTIIEEILSLKEKADIDNKKIDKIIVSREEWAELARTIRYDHGLYGNIEHQFIPSKKVGVCCGVDIFADE